MPSAIPSGVLFFNMYDPTHRAHLPAETITATQLGCYSTSVVTALSVQDSNSIIDVVPISSDTIDAQARFILEDIKIRAFKIGNVFAIETLDAIAAIATDYQDTPLISTFGKHFYNHVEVEEPSGGRLYTEMLTDAYLDILAPLSYIAVIDSHYAQQWTSDDFDIHSTEDLVRYALDSGAEYCLVLNEKHGNSMRHRLVQCTDREDYFIHDPHVQTPAEFADMVASALACLTANGENTLDSVNLALTVALKQIEHQIQLGMGKSQPDRLAYYEA